MKKRALVAFLAATMLVGSLAGCNSSSGGSSTTTSSGGSSSTSTSESGESAEASDSGDANAEAIANRTETQTIVLNWFTWTGSPNGLDRIEEKMNELTIPELNLAVEMQVTDFASRSQQLTLAISGGEQLDIINTNGLGYNVGIANGYYWNLEEDNLLSTYGSGIIETMGMDDIDACRDSEGILYGLPQQKENGQGRYSLAVVTEDLKAAEEYMDLVPDYDSPCWEVNGLTDIVTIVKALKEARPDKDAFCPSSLYSWTDIDILGDSFGVLGDYGTGDIVSMFDDDSYLETVNAMHDLYNSGCINPNALTDTTAAATQVEAGTLCSYVTNYKPNSKVQETNLCGGNDITVVKGGEDFAMSGTVSGNWAITINTDDPVAAMQYLNFMYTSSEWNTLYNWGEEEVDFNVVDGTAQFVENAEYNHAMQWTAPGQFQTYPEYGNSTDLWDQYDEFNTNAIKSDAYAFMFDQTPVRNEYTALNNVYQQYQKSIEFGAVDPAPALEEMKAALDSAGYQKYLDEKQAQYTAWKEANGNA